MLRKGVSQWGHITPVVFQSSVCFQAEFSILVMTLEGEDLNGLDPGYLRDHYLLCQPAHSLWSRGEKSFFVSHLWWKCSLLRQQMGPSWGCTNNMEHLAPWNSGAWPRPPDCLLPAGKYLKKQNKISGKLFALPGKSCFVLVFSWRHCFACYAILCYVLSKIVLFWCCDVWLL